MANPTMKVSGLNHGNSYPVKDHLDTNVMLTDNVALYQRHLGLVSLADYLSSVIYPDDSFENFFRFGFVTVFSIQDVFKTSSMLNIAIISILVQNGLF